LGRSGEARERRGRALAAVPDEVLVRRARHGDVLAFELLVRRHTGLVYRVAVRALPSGVDPEDCVQETWLAAWQGIRRFRGESAVTTWLYRIAVNQAMLAARRRRPVQSLEVVSETAEAGAEDPAEAAERAEAVARVRRALSRLHPSDRVPLVLVAYDGLTMAELAAVLRVPVPTAKTRLRRARLRLLRLLEEPDGL
jgi:RNA polymerase sigma-70 factor (ECF subfamily)